MTTIAAIKTNTGVLMGADSSGVSGWSLTYRADPKIYRVGKFLFGFTSSFRMGQTLGFSFAPPDRPLDCPVYKYMATLFIDGVREAFKKAGIASKTNEVEACGVFLVAYEGRIFRVDNDYQVGESLENFDACGMGESIALAALWSTKAMNDQKIRLAQALECCEHYSCGVRGPFNYEELVLP